ncbi:Hypothetical predicted protein [Cloeon dipterum]|uniref:protein-tyrosine-phosphatase n=1 Tax=Cloeon dipterum TaxID=197152 RepID=A0A8S1D830_9INSE|nr:Hypothetical predicted protein [Cloeon dipterum]
MKLKLNESSSKFCVDVVYLSTQRSQEMEKLLSLELRDANGKLKYNKSITSKNNSSWTVQRFRSNRMKLANGSTIILTAHVESLVIGGVKFCKEGDLIFKHNMRNPNGCHLLEKTTEEPDTSLLNEKFNSILFTECKAFKGNCSGLELCKNESRECECFAGFQRSVAGTCTTGCKDRNLGVYCSSVSTKKCTEDKINHTDGNCLLGCADGFLPPQCETGLDHQGADEYLFEIRRGGNLEACVLDELTLAFVPDKIENNSNSMSVNIKDLNGNAIALSEFDCNLLRENGCNSWKLTEFELFNGSNSFPIITDYRWSDLPKNAILSDGKKWVHATLEISFNNTNKNNSLVLGDTTKIRYFPTSDETKGTEYFVSYRTNDEGFFKQHTYDALRSLKSNSSMEVKLNDSSSSAFCVDVVYLSNKHLHGNATLFSLELKDENGTSKYKESVASKDSFEWTTARFRSDNISLEKDTTLTLNAHVESLVIGGVKFCKEGDLIFEPIVKNPKSCHSVATKAKNEKQETDEKFNSRLLTLISDCNLFDKNCAGLKVCKNQNNKSCCTCFAGFKGDNCQNRCQGKNFGVNCSLESTKKCLNDSINHVNGNCSLGCADGFLPPQCEKADKQSVLLLILIIMPLNSVLLASIGAWIYFKKCRKRQQTFPEATVHFTKASETCTAKIAPLVEENRGDEPIYDVPFNASQVEQYLQSAFKDNFLQEQFKKFPRGQTQPWDVGTKPENTKKNRYNNLAAYDSSRVKLHFLSGDENSDYINANYVDEHERPKAYIASQGPMANTVDDFWRMVWQEQVTLIVMVTNLTEEDKVKCEKYWPDACQESKFGLFFEKTKKLVQQLHFTNWPSHGVPLYPQSIAIFMEKITHRNELAPILVHCSAGVGRTGTVILIDTCLRMKQFEFVHLVLWESILNPKFEINCENFSEEYKLLTLKSNKKMKENLNILTEICNKDFQRAEKVAEIEANKCRYPEIISTSSSIISLFPYGDVTTMNFINAVIVDGYNIGRSNSLLLKCP